MKKIVLICGLIAGGIAAGTLLVSALVRGADKMVENGMIYGYGSMILAFSLIFVGIKNFRDKYNQGMISFGKAFRIGLLISLIASSMYVLAWMIYSHYHPEFMEIYTNATIDQLRVSGAAQAEIDKKAAEMASWGEWYKNPILKALITYMEILPVGILISVIAALILKKKKPAMV
jgi:hypothetical protein